MAFIHIPLPLRTPLLPCLSPRRGIFLSGRAKWRRTSNAPEIEHVHDRMPVIVSPKDYNRWLDLGISDKETLLPLLNLIE
ncbi:MAG: SOS response-associated peptidase family protein [Steroidobacteraceae bacterium]